ncbi:hypothetical protein LY90DRAFT_55624 [Neocallimastix californiae]|uniref:RING-type domain-containing protein n=1 Tax=Neocallimastix californiae TaxID=1754190 RepID=A0A1Y2BQV9_9FUNG|nr:hypothetical protein LY90DRAFT_55624 [Neocallimastix californiae]|eukprot:ORY37123.1 hypothetical protein LY90DRAFT_55624 [Neocallimastix californiae]
MGNTFSRRRAQRGNIPSTISYFTNSFGLYFGPYFIMNRNENRNITPATRNLINEQVQNNIMTGTGLLWSDLLEAVENGVITEQELSEFGLTVGNTQISEYDAPITIQSLVNLHKHSVKIAKVEFEEKESKNLSNNINIDINNDDNNNNNNNSNNTLNRKSNDCIIQIDSLMSEKNNYFNNKNCRVKLEFEYDSYTPCQVHLFWNAREVIVKNGNEKKAIYLLNHNENRNSMTIGPLPAGNNQKFVLPDVINIPADVVDDIIKQTNELSLNATSTKNNGTSDIPNEEGNNSNTGEVNTVDVNSEINNNNNNNERNGSSSSNVEPDNSSVSSRLRIGRNMFNHRRRSSSRSTKGSKKNQKEKKIVWYPLIIVIESLDKKDEKANDSSIKYQSTFLKLEISNETNQYNIKSIDQKVMIKNNLYRLQEIYGFTDETDAEQVVTNEVNTSIECVICLSEPRNTVVLPCRHLCVCQDCADILCNQSRHDHRSSYLSTPRCPICRQAFHSFLRINMDYFDLNEDSCEKVKEPRDDISITKGKKGDSTIPEKKYDIIATSRMIENEEDEEDEEEKKKEMEEEEEEKEEEKEEEYNKTIFEDNTEQNPNNATNVTERTEESHSATTEKIKNNEEEKEKSEYYLENVNDSNHISDNSSNDVENNNNNNNNNNNSNKASTGGPLEHFSIDSLD